MTRWRWEPASAGGLSIAALVRQTGRPVEVAACYLASEALKHHQAWLCLTCAA